MRLTIALWCLCIATAASAVVFVDVDATGANNGTSWADAYVNLTNAIALEVDGSEFWVAEGSYAPGGDTAFFDLKGSNMLYGGFAGTETERDQRDFTNRIVRLEGGGTVDNICKKSAAGRSTVDGFWIVNGNGGNGAGIDSAIGSLSVSNCRLTNNVGVQGGAVIIGTNPERSAFTNTFFVRNGATSVGGAIYLQSSASAGSVDFDGCGFTNNIANGDGGGIWVSDRDPVRLLGCSFVTNHAAGNGGGFAAVGFANGAQVSVTNCVFEWNRSDANGGCGYYTSDSSMTVDGCTMHTNRAGVSAGDFYVTGQAEQFFFNSSFVGSFATSPGGSIRHADRGWISVSNCAFIACESGNSGGAIRMQTPVALPSITDCVFSNCVSGFRGGCIYVAGRSFAVDVDRCKFFGNSAATDGGVFFDENRIGIKSYWDNCLFYSNSANRGGCFWIDFDSPIAVVSGCTIVSNTCVSATGGGFAYLTSVTQLYVTNSILYGNLASGVRNDIYTSSFSGGPIINTGHTLIDTNIITGPLFRLTVTDGVFFADPLFADQDNKDFRLKSRGGRWNGSAWVSDDVTSPAIDVGQPFLSTRKEPEPNGALLNLGYDGGSEFASFKRGTLTFHDGSLIGTNGFLFAGPGQN